MALTRLNFIASNPWWPRLGWFYLVPALLLLGYAVQDWQQQQAVLQQWQGKLQKLQSQQNPPRVQRSKQEQRDLDVHASNVANAVRQINLPLPTILKALQAPKDIRVALLSVEMGGKAGAIGGANGSATQIKLLAEAKNGAEMANYVAFLDDLPLFQSVYLQKHEIPQDSKEGHYRFQMEMLWQP